MLPVLEPDPKPELDPKQKTVTQLSHIQVYSVCEFGSVLVYLHGDEHDSIL